MVSLRLAVLATVLLGLASSTSCKVLVEDNCANQPVPGNEFCRELYGNAAPYCSPCRRDNNGCVENPPFSCRGYYDEVSEDEDDGPDDGESSSEGGGESSTGPEVMTGSSSEGGSGSGPGTTGGGSSTSG